MSTPARLPRQSFIGTGTSTPSRPGSSQSLLPQHGTTGIPTPSNSARRKSSLGTTTPTHGAGSNGGSPHYADDDEHANAALAEAMRIRPPSSVGSSAGMNYSSGSVYGTGRNGEGNGSYGRASGRIATSGIGRDEVSTPPPALGQRQLSNDPSSSSFSTPPYPSSLRQSALRNPAQATSTPKTPVGAVQAATRARIASTALGRSTMNNGTATGTPTTPSAVKRTVSAYTPGGGSAANRRVSTAGLGNSSMRPPAPPRTPTSGSSTREPMTNGGKTPPSRSPAPPHYPLSSASSSSVTASQRARPAWSPDVGDDVRIPSMGFEGVLRYKGPVRGKGEDIFAGVELFEGFKGRGRNNGEVGADRYFQTTDLRGLFIPIAKLARSTVNPARAPSVASSHRSAASSVNGGRATPAFSMRSGASGRETPFISEAVDEDYDGRGGVTTTPSKAGWRSVSQASSANWTAKVPPVPDHASGSGGGTSSRTSISGGMSSAQLAARKALAQSEASLSAGQADSTPGASLRESVASTTTTPKAVRLPRRSEIGSSINPVPSSYTTPSRSVSVNANAVRSVSRQSVAGGAGPVYSTPKAGGTASRSGRMSIASGRMSVASNYESMPPPISPSKYGSLSGGRLGLGDGARAEEVVGANAALLDKIQDLERQLERSLGGMTLEEREKAKKLADQRMRELSLAGDLASREVSTIKIELENVRAAKAELESQQGITMTRLEEVASQLTYTESTLARTERDLKIQKERAEEELEKGMEIKRKEVRAAEERLKDMESQLQQAQLHVSELTEAGQMSIAILEKKVSDSQAKRFELEHTLRQVEDKLAETEAQVRQLETPPSPSTAARRADTAATIDNENLKAQVAHQKDKINGLEDQLEDLRVEKEGLEATSAIAIAKSKEAEKRVREELTKSRVEVDGLKAQAAKAKSQIAELEYAVKESKATLAHTQVEVEALRVEIGDLQNLRGAQTALTKVEKERTRLADDLTSTRENLAARQAELDQLTRAFSELKSKHDLHLPYADSPGGRNRDSTDSSGARKPRMSNGMTDAEKSLRGFQHIIQELTSENATLRQKVFDLEQDLKQVRAELDLATTNQVDSKLPKLLATTERKLELAYAELHRTTTDFRITEKNLDMEIAQLDNMIADNIGVEENLRDEIERMEAELLALNPSWTRSEEREVVLRTKVAGPVVDGQEEELATGSEPVNPDAPDQRPAGRTAIADASASKPVSLPNSANPLDSCFLCQGNHDMEQCKLWTGKAADSPASAKVVTTKMTASASVSERSPPSTTHTSTSTKSSPAEVALGVSAGIDVEEGEEMDGPFCYQCLSSTHDDGECPPEVKVEGQGGEALDDDPDEAF